MCFGLLSTNVSPRIGTRSPRWLIPFGHSLCVCVHVLESVGDVLRETFSNLACVARICWIRIPGVLDAFIAVLCFENMFLY